MNKLKEILSLCKCSVSLEVNQHRDYYMSAERYLDEDIARLECPPDIDAETRKKMIETDTIINLHFYPLTPIGFYDLYDYDLDRCLDTALQILKGDQNDNQS